MLLEYHRKQVTVKKSSTLMLSQLKPIDFRVKVQQIDEETALESVESPTEEKENLVFEPRSTILSDANKSAEAFKTLKEEDKYKSQSNPWVDPPLTLFEIKSPRNKIKCSSSRNSQA